MRKFRKLLSAVTAAAMSISMAASGMAGGLSSVNAADKSAVDLVDDMGMGWNLGNTFDCWGVRGWESQTEKGWGNPVTSKAMIDAIKATGFDSVRIPVTWYENTDAGTFDIDDAYLARVKTVVDYCIDNDMYAIINMHWDWESDGSLWLNKGEAALPQFTTMWTEIANYFKDYDEHLVFEDMNEVTFEYNVLNNFNQTFVDTVRATGGNNADRLLLLAGKNTNLDDTCSSQFVVPDDDMVAVSIHYYLPPKFTVGTKSGGWGYSDTWGTDADVNELVNYFNKMKTTFADKGVPVILGEYGVVTNDGKDADSIRKFLRTVANQALNTKGISAFLWDAGQAGDMQFFNRETLSWRDAQIGQIYADLGNGNTDNLSIGWVETTFEAVTNDKTGEVVPGTYRINIGNATQFRIEIEAEHKSTGGVGGISYWDNNANSGKGGWVNNALGVNFAYDKDGVSNVSQTAEDANGDTVTVNDNFFELPEGVSTDSVQFQMFYVGYSNEAGDWVDKDVAYPTIVKAYVTGAVDGEQQPSEEIPSEEIPSEEIPSEEIPSEEIPSEEIPSEEIPSEETPGDDTPADDTPTDGYTFALHGQYAGNGFWDEEYTVKVDKSGTYSIYCDNVGETKDGDLALFIDTDVNVYEYAVNEDSTGIKDGTLNITIDSIKVDGVEIPYTYTDGSLTTMDDGKSMRLNIYNTWTKPNVKDIDPNLTVAEGIEFTFTVKLGGEDAPADIVYGDTNGDGEVDIMDVIALNKFLLGSSTLEGDARKAADVDNNKAVDSTDSLNILKYVVELIDKLPV